MKKSFLMILVVCAVLTSCASNKVELSTLGKSGSITMKIASHSKIDKIDDEPTKLRGSCKLEPGFHTFGIDYYHITPDYLARAYVNKEFYFEEGKSYSMKSIESSGYLLLPIREKSAVISKSWYFGKSAEDPEAPAKSIRSIKTFPKNQKFEVVGTFEITLSGSVFASSSLTEDRAFKYLESFVANSEYDVDAFVDAYSCRTMSGQVANAVGIKFVEE